MAGIERLAETMGEGLSRVLSRGRDEAEVYSFSLKILLGFAMGLAVLLAMAWPLGVLPLALPAALTGGVLRLFSGGAHSGSPLGCAVTGGVVACLIGMTARWASLTYSASVLFLATYLVVPWVLAACAIYAPASVPQKPIPNHQRRKLSVLSLAFVFLWTLSLVFLTKLLRPETWLSSALGLAWQAFSLTPLGFRFGLAADSILSRREVRG